MENKHTPKQVILDWEDYQKLVQLEGSIKEYDETKIYEKAYSDLIKKLVEDKSHVLIWAEGGQYKAKIYSLISHSEWIKKSYNYNFRACEQ